MGQRRKKIRNKEEKKSQWLMKRCSTDMKETKRDGKETKEEDAIKELHGFAKKGKKEEEVQGQKSKQLGQTGQMVKGRPMGAKRRNKEKKKKKK
jgi:hypothetical protein